MKFIISFCFLLLFSLFLINCSQKESSPVNPEETNNLYKGKPSKEIMYVVSEDITGVGTSVDGDIQSMGKAADIILTYDEEAFADIRSYVSDGAEGIMTIGTAGRNSVKRTFIHYFDRIDEGDVHGWQGIFHIIGYFDKKESYPLTFDGPWILRYFHSETDIDTIEGEGAIVTVDVVN